MSVASSLKNTASIILGLAVLVGIFAIGTAFLLGSAAFSVWVFKWTFPAFAITLLVSVVVLAPLALIPPARAFSTIGFIIASFAFGVILWVWAMAYTLSVWGLLGVIIGFVLGGIGVVPVAMFAALVHGDWGNLGLFIATAVVTVALRALAQWLADKVEERSARLNRSDITVQAYEIRE